MICFSYGIISTRLFYFYRVILKVGDFVQRKKIWLLILGIFSIFTLFFVYHDDFLYHEDLLKIEKITTIDTYTSMNPLGFEEKYYNQKIEGIITNGKNKGMKKTVFYEESFSSVVTDRYRVGDKLILKNGEIEGLKRDFYITLLLVLFVLLMVIVGEFQGFLSIITVVFNILLFYIGLHLYFRGIPLLLLCVIESTLFSILSLFIAGGRNKKTMSALASVMVSFTVLFIMILLVTKGTDYSGINFNELSFLTIAPEDILIPELLIGTLGAIMDVAITICSAIGELIEKDPKISVSNLRKSSKQIGKDIMSTMTNVLFFTYLCGSLPVFVLALRNGFSIYNYVMTNFSLELTRFLVGSIGIILTIPISTWVCIQLFRRRRI